MDKNQEKNTEKQEEIVKVSAKREKFCQLFVKYGRNGTKAYMEAYGSENEAASAVSANRLLKDDKVKSRIAQLEAPIIEELQVDAKWVLGRSIEIVDRCMQHEPVIIKGPDGPEQAVDPETGQGIFCFDAKGANQALALIAKHTGGFIERQDHTTKGDKIKQNIYNIINPEQQSAIEKSHSEVNEL